MAWRTLELADQAVSGDVTSVFGRTGNVSAANGDYDVTQITNADVATEVLALNTDESIYNDNGLGGNSGQPIAPPLNKAGWYYRNGGTDEGTDNSIAWRVLSNEVLSPYSVNEIKYMYMVLELTALGEVYFNVYTDDGLPLPSTFLSRFTFTSGGNFAQAGTYLVWASFDPLVMESDILIFPNLPRIRLPFDNGASSGPLDPAETIKSLNLTTSTGKAEGTVEFRLLGTGYATTKNTSVNALPLIDNGTPSLTTVERNALKNPKNGMGIFNLDTQEIQYKVDNGWYCTKKSSIGCGSVDTIVLTDDATAPNFITGFQGGFLGFEIEDVPTGTFKNVMGRNVQAMTGTISFHPTETGGGTGLLQLVSEKCPAGADWTNQANWTLSSPTTLRTVQVPSNGESFATKVSFIANVPDQSYFRFRMYEAGAGGITLTPTSDTILGQAVTSASATFELTEQYTIDPIV